MFIDFLVHPIRQTANSTLIHVRWYNETRSVCRANDDHGFYENCCNPFAAHWLRFCSMESYFTMKDVDTNDTYVVTNDVEFYYTHVYLGCIISQSV